MSWGLAGVGGSGWAGGSTAELFGYYGWLEFVLLAGSGSGGSTGVGLISVIFLAIRTKLL